MGHGGAATVAGAFSLADGMSDYPPFTVKIQERFKEHRKLYIFIAVAIGRASDAFAPAKSGPA